MPPRFSGHFSSETFKIIAESGRKCFNVHRDILAAQSEPLRSATTGNWKEATEREIELLDWDGATVGRLVQFLYSGDYQVSEPSSEEEEEGESVEYDGANERDTMQSPVDPEEWRGIRDGMNTPDTVQSQADQEEWKDENLFLAHAKVYALAQYKDVEDLKAMALKRLSSALFAITPRMLSAAVTMHFIELLVYVHSHTDSPTSSEEPLRDVVLGFATDYFEKLMECKELGLLLREGGDLASELVERLALRLDDAEKRIWASRDRFKETRMELDEEIERYTELSSKLEFAEEEAQAWKDRALASEERMRQIVTEGAHEVLELEKSVAAMEKLLGDERAAKNSVLVKWLIKTEARIHKTIGSHWQEPIISFSGWRLSPYDISCVVAVLVVAIIAILFAVHLAAPIPGTIDAESFKQICQYYEANSWHGGGSVAVGERGLKEVCSEYIPGSWVQQPSFIPGGSTKDLCRFYESSLWIGSGNRLLEGKPLKEVCINKYLVKRSGFF